MLLRAIGELLLLALGVALNPFPAIAVVLLLAGPSGRRGGAAFVAGWLIGLSSLMTVALLAVNSCTSISSRVVAGRRPPTRHGWATAWPACSSTPLPRPARCRALESVELGSEVRVLCEFPLSGRLDITIECTDGVCDEGCRGPPVEVGQCSGSRCVERFRLRQGDRSSADDDAVSLLVNERRVDYGQRWISARAPGVEWRIAWNTGTGEVYAARRDDADLHVLGIARNFAEVETALQGWASHANQSGGLDWRSNGPVISPATTNSRSTSHASAPTSPSWPRARNLSAGTG